MFKRKYKVTYVEYDDGKGYDIFYKDLLYWKPIYVPVKICDENNVVISNHHMYKGNKMVTIFNSFKDAEKILHYLIKNKLVENKYNKIEEKIYTDNDFLIKDIIQ